MSHSISNPHFLMRRLHSLFGLLPVGGFLLFHLWENSQSRFGRDYYNQYVVEKIQGLNYVLLLEIFVIALPILWHVIYGLVIWWFGRANVTQYGYLRNWMWWLQRVSGIGILFFLLLHVGWTRLLAIFDPTVKQDMFSHMQAMLADRWWLAAYVVGLLLAIFHLCNGLWTMAISWGLLTSAEAQKRMQWAALLAFVVLSALGIHGLVGFFVG
ncbi:MAG: succinate dehydrogenase [Deltaproteobacteria bacterium]|nr:succinate dehydrogenase [Deltaproteobacteria bacterium]